MKVAFCWQDKKALRLIRERIDGGSVATCIAVYVALTEHASNCETENFQVAASYIGSLAGVTTKTALRRIADLRDIGLVETQCPALRTTLTFKMLPINGAGIGGNGCRTLGNKVPTQGNKVPTQGQGQTPSLSLNRIKEERNTPPTPIQAPKTVDTPAPLSWRKKFAEELLKD